MIESRYENFLGTDQVHHAMGNHAMRNHVRRGPSVVFSYVLAYFEQTSRWDFNFHEKSFKKEFMV